MRCEKTGFICYVILFVTFVSVIPLKAQFGNNKAFATIDFGNTLHEWDGFGFNYVESCKTLDYENDPQDLGGFTILNHEQKHQVIELIFGQDGLRPSTIKMFLDPWHLEKRGGHYNHEWSTKNMRYFVQHGLKTAHAIGDSLQIITTLYGPPPFMTKHNSPSTSVLNPDYKKDLAMYMIDWLHYLKEHEYPVKYLSIHNEGTDWLRWPQYKNQPNAVQLDRDYNLLWRPKDIADFMAFMKPLMIKKGVGDIGLTPGEPINLFRLNHFGIADEIAQNKAALHSIDLITSHGFGFGNPFGRGYANTNNYGATLLQKFRPELKTWVTSASWGGMDVVFGAEIYEHIYGNKASAFIPWAGIQRSPEWGDKNKHDGCAISVLEDSTFRVNKGYYLYKQFTTAGRPGTRVVRTTVNRPEVFIAAFARQKPEQADAFIVLNVGESNKYLTDLVEVRFNVNDNPLYYHFPYKDLILSYEQANPNQMNDVEFAAHPTKDGYLMEFAFPWKTLGGISQKASRFNFDVNVRDGRDMPHGRIGWLGENNDFTGKIQTDKSTSSGKKGVVILEQNFKPEIDGHADQNWSAVTDYAISNNLMPGTPPKISGKWKMTVDDENVYLLVRVKDPTNEQGRLLQIAVEGTAYKTFRAFRTDEFGENCHELDRFSVQDGKIDYLSPNHSVTTFIGVE